MQTELWQCPDCDGFSKPKAFDRFPYPQFKPGRYRCPKCCAQVLPIAGIWEAYSWEAYSPSTYSTKPMRAEVKG